MGPKVELPPARERGADLYERLDSVRDPAAKVAADLRVLVGAHEALEAGREGMREREGGRSRFGDARNKSQMQTRRVRQNRRPGACLQHFQQRRPHSIGEGGDRAQAEQQLRQLGEGWVGRGSGLE